jgi:hypothetical protein
MRRALNWILGWLSLWRGRRPPGSPHDPYARTRSRLKPRPPDRSSAIAVAEPDDV